MGLILNILESTDVPKYKQIVEQVVRLVDEDIMREGSRMPSSREMAQTLGLNRSTVYRAYQELWALGYLESRPGAYSTIRKRSPIVYGNEKNTKSVLDWSRVCCGTAEGLYDVYQKEQTLCEEASPAHYIDFSVLSPAAELFPLDDFRKCLNQVMVNFGAELLEYGDIQGYKPLREYISERMKMHSVWIAPEEILITTGAQNGIELMMHLLTEPGDSVAFESPTYSRALDLFRMHSVEPVPIVMEEKGMDLDSLENFTRKRKLKLIYTIPNFHNPTGITSIQQHRERLIGICEQYGVPLIEDGFEEEMKYFGKAVLPIKSMDRGGVVVYIGTFSKILFPGLRVGWIAADRECIKRLIPLKRASSLGGSHLLQAALEQFCRRGFYDFHIKRMHRMYRKRMAAALKQMEKEFNNIPVTWITPAGGYTIWIKINRRQIPEYELIRKLWDRGIKITPGSPYYFDDAGVLYLRLSIAHTTEKEIETGIHRIREGIESFID